MADFNFGTLATTQVSNSSAYLRPWNIYSDVKFEGVEGPTSGVSQAGTKWEKYEFVFSSPDGKYTESIFTPVAGKSNIRGKFTNSEGHEVELPSEFERTMAFIAQVGNTFNPDGYKILQEKSSKIKDFATLIQVFNKVIGQPDVKTNLKLVGKESSDGKVYAKLPTFVRINSKTGEAFTSDNFVGDNVAFTAWELGKKKDYDNAKPKSVAPAGIQTAIDTDVTADAPQQATSDDLADLLGDI